MAIWPKYGYMVSVVDNMGVFGSSTDTHTHTDRHTHTHTHTRMVADERADGLNPW